MDYSQEELNQILLSKPLNAFYLAIIEHRGELLTDEEFAKTLCKKEVIAVLNSFKHDNLFYGGFISMNSHGTSCALNFSDDVLEIPFAKVVNESVIQCYKDNVGKFLEFLKVVQE